MWHKAGLPSIIGVGVLLLMTIPAHTVFLSLARQIRTTVATLTDSRVQLMNELIGGIEVSERQIRKTSISDRKFYIYYFLFD